MFCKTKIFGGEVLSKNKIPYVWYGEFLELHVLAFLLSE